MNRDRHAAAQFDIEAGVLNPYDNCVPEDREDAVALGILNNLITSNITLLEDLKDWEMPQRQELKTAIADIVRVGMADRRVSTRQEDYEQMLKREAEKPRDPNTMTAEEQAGMVAHHAYQIADSWAHRESSRLCAADRVYGAVHDVLGMLEGNRENVPAFDLVPVTFDPDLDTTIPHVVRLAEPNLGSASPLIQVNADWNFEERMSVERGAKLTTTFSNLYDRHRERFAAAAKELFETY